ncbi:MAG: anthranilate synthase component I family protein [Candidatus Omnitrophica bacterium]|nr:anthranilate synthase component I family protein [Candidatus Omnitrophota bacterium]
MRTFESPFSPWDLFKALYGNSDSSFFLDSAGSPAKGPAYSYLGAHPFAELRMDRDGLFLKEGRRQRQYPVSKLSGLLRSLLKKYRPKKRSRLPFFSGGAVGFLGYEMAAFFEKKVRFRKKPKPQTPFLYFGFYRDLIVYDHRKKKYFELGSRRRPLITGTLEVKNERFHVHRFHAEMSEGQFKGMITKAKRFIKAGDIYQSNLSQRFSFEFSGSPLALYEQSREINPSPFAAYLSLGDLKLISNSPERLVSKRNRLCETKPIAGTKPIGVSPKALKLNPKERAEHIMLVDLERNDLGRVCDYHSIRVKELMKIEKYSHLMHLVSTLTGTLKKNCDGWDLLRAVFPGGTITGCPKIRCMEIIDELEPVGRGLYTGSLGYFGFDGDLDFNIVIRTLILKRNRGWLQVGAGIVQDSDPRLEYEETLHKGEALCEALVRASVEKG